MGKEVLLNTDFKDLKLFKKGKVRDVYDLGSELLIVSTDRISCFDVVLPCGIPNKGKVLNRLSIFWFDFTKNIIPNHLIESDIDRFPKELLRYEDILKGRSIIVKKTAPIPVECVVRGYLSGSGWKEYLKSGSVCGIELPEGLKESEELPKPLFTPATKEEVGHDINVTQDFVEKKIGKEVAERLKGISIKVYKKASEFAERKGIIIADTKFEFGIFDKKIILIDELLTPDSSRFWPRKEYKKGSPQPNFDKQFVRDYLETLDWDKTPPAPELPRDIIEKTSQKYIQALEMIAGECLI